MSVAFVCSEGEKIDENHATSTAMVKCAHCGKFAVAGYWCDNCDHKDVDPGDNLVGHGPGKCVAGEEVRVVVTDLGSLFAKEPR